MSRFHFAELSQTELRGVVVLTLLTNFFCVLNPVARGICMSSGLDLSRKRSGDASL